ncbi:Crp/Fnr family transcriptional regulator [Ancylobacter sp. 6x-1]|uniref:Crp/Fnr family transcriptional regulator n=1 Tax=Ancylobacter crimeensis TaxID=2579147 RepID=A0ABT0D7H1_9HYPH|nr:Crp/Fnr family transcriptional regulator [Ancylobacter crimeensis]MCK0195891.1 Crp/Fnr family transcriptional regulator [Ancylobacter crimeensis]
MRVRCFECPLRRRRAFKPKTETEVGFLDALKRDHLSVPPGTELIQQGQEDADLYTLFSGWAFRFKTLPDGRRQILHFLLPGDFIGLQGAMFDASLHGVETLTDAEFCVFPRRRVWSLFEQVPQLAFEVSWLGAHEESMVDENLVSVGLRNAGERVAALILMLHRRCRTLDLVAPDNSIPFPLNQGHIADALGLSLVHTNKTIARLRRLGLFAQSNGRLTLLNPKVMERLAQYYEDEPAPRPII